ncbi:hypothetical protein HQN89_32435 [Paenibacillus frigoriresistens]|uniref:hypothetical protein n=1 Tax=Paenibacillus alginolyticus TaxID=59839 RepID=UPI0015667F65|nr:hypothetical protein [Paenibacillus frigoriresistens]NRF95550.1 hypothetical protein [Paenibacillus frigoriresistens]
MARKKLALIIIILTIIICSVNVLVLYRWDYSSKIIENDMIFKIDRWTNITWVEFYAPLASGNAMEFPLLSNSNINSYPQLESHVAKIGMSGYLASEWIKRQNLTNLYYAIDVLLILSIFIVLILIIRRKKITTG